MTEEATLRETLASLAALTAALSKASGALLGKSAKSIMYLSGSDMGRVEGRKLDRTDDLARAIEMLVDVELRGWGVELWKDADQEEYVVEEPGLSSAWLLFHECPVRQVCLAYDVRMGDALCQLSHGYLAGVLSEILGRKAQLVLEHAGTNACKKQLRVKQHGRQDEGGQPLLRLLHRLSHGPGGRGERLP